MIKTKISKFRRQREKELKGYELEDYWIGTKANWWRWTLKLTRYFSGWKVRQSN